MKRTLIILLTLVMCLPILRAQQESLNTLSVDLGMGSLKKQDLIFSPFIIQDWSPANIMLQYGHSNKLEQRASLRLGQYSKFVGDPFSFVSRGEEYPKYPHNFVMLDLNYALGKRLSLSNNISLIAGGRLRNRFHITNYEFGNAGQFEYFLSSGVDAWLGISYSPQSKHNVQSNIYVPLVSTVARSPYLGQDDDYLERISVHGDLKIFWEHIKTEKITSWGTTQILDFDLNYDYEISERWTVGLTYLFSMNLSSSPQQLTSYENIIYLGTTFKF